MARARNIKPGFFKNEILAELTFEQRLLFIGLWTLADREGRLEDRPKRIKAELFAFESVEVEPMLDRLHGEGFLVRYEVEGTKYIQITNFVKHQDPHYKEKASEIPPPPGTENQIKAVGVTKAQRQRILERDGFQCKQCGSEDHLSIDHVIPVSRGGDSSDENLQTLCLRCNTSKSNRLDGEERATKRVKPKMSGCEFDVDERRTELGLTKAPHALGFSDSPSSDSLIADTPAAPAPPLAPKAKKSKPSLTPIPEDFGISERVRKWAERKGFGQLDDHLEAFIRKSKAKGYENASWDDAFMEAIREDWAKLRGRSGDGSAPPPEHKRQERDPALVKLEEDAKKAAPIPLAELEKMARIRQGVKA